MTRTAFGAALLCLGVLLLPLPSQAAQRATPHGPVLRPAPFRAHGLLRPIAPRVLSHGLPARPHHRRRFLHGPLLVPALAGTSVLRAGTVIEVEAVQPPSGPALVRTGGTVGCAMEDVMVPGDGGKTITIIRC